VSDFEFSSSSAGGASRRWCATQGRVRRTARLLNFTARTACEATAIGVRGKITGADTRALQARTAARYAELLGHSRGVLMKAAQMLSFAPMDAPALAGLLPVYQEALALLRADAPPMTPELARRALERELGPIESVFCEFDWRPLAAASIGQVHAARLHDGRRVAVKIQYPEAAEAIGTDLKNVELLATMLRLLSSCLPAARKLSFDVRGGARELGVRISEELDYWREATNQDEFASVYRGHPFIHVPEVVWELCTERVLTQELMVGMRWEHAVHASQDLRDRWAEAIWRFVYGSNSRFRVFHADPHPGNYLFHKDGSVSFLDFGCVKRFRPDHARMMAATGPPCVEGDVQRLWCKCVELGFWRPDDPVAAEDVFDYWRGALEMYWREQPFTITPERAAKWITHRVNPTGRSANAMRHCTLPADYTVIARIEAGTNAIFAHLHATKDWASIASEYFLGELPTTQMGKLDRAFFEEREAAGRV